MTEEHSRRENPSPEDDRGFRFADFINAWVRHWKIFLLTVFVFLAAGLIHFKTRPLPPFVHTTTIEIGAQGDGELLEKFESLKRKVEAAYIPEALIAHAQEHGYVDQRYVVLVQSLGDKVKKTQTDEGENDGTLTLLSHGSLATTEDLLALHGSIAERIVRDHGVREEIARQSLREEKLQQEHLLEKLEEEERAIPQERKIIDQREALVQRQIERTKDVTHTLEQDRARALVAAAEKETLDQSLATSFLLLDNTLTQYREELRTLEEKDFVFSENRAALDQKVTEVQRKKRAQQLVIQDIEFQIENFRSTRILLPPSRLPRLPRAGVLYQTLVIFAGVGSILGLALIVFFEAAADARRELREKRSPHS